MHASPISASIFFPTNRSFFVWRSFFGWCYQPGLQIDLKIEKYPGAFKPGLKMFLVLVFNTTGTIVKSGRLTKDSFFTSDMFSKAKF